MPRRDAGSREVIRAGNGCICREALCDDQDRLRKIGRAGRTTMLIVDDLQLGALGRDPHDRLEKIDTVDAVKPRRPQDER